MALYPGGGDLLKAAITMSNQETPSTLNDLPTYLVPTCQHACSHASCAALGTVRNELCETNDMKYSNFTLIIWPGLYWHSPARKYLNMPFIAFRFPKYLVFLKTYKNSSLSHTVPEIRVYRDADN